MGELAAQLTFLGVLVSSCRTYATYPQQRSGVHGALLSRDYSAGNPTPRQDALHEVIDAMEKHEYGVLIVVYGVFAAKARMPIAHTIGGAARIDADGTETSANMALTIPASRITLMAPPLVRRTHPVLFSIVI